MTPTQIANALVNLPAEDRDFMLACIPPKVIRALIEMGKLRSFVKRAREMKEKGCTLDDVLDLTASLAP